MDSKNTYIPKYNPKNAVQNYITESKTDYSIIDNIYNIFSTEEFDVINKVLQSNQILNFRTEKGETLIHAILRNPSSKLTEFQIKNIIENLIHKNVSINAMNEFNQTSMHLASIKGYYDVINYLIAKKCDYNTIDNYGNAPLHYLIDNFVTECKDGEYYKSSNQIVKKSDSTKNKKYDQIVNNLILVNLIDTIDTKVKIVDEDDYISIGFAHIKRMIVLYNLYSVDDVHKIVNQKKLEIENLYTNANASNIENIKKNIEIIVGNSVKDFSSLYKNFDVDLSKLSNKSNGSTLIDEINKKVEDTKRNITIELDSKLQRFNENIGEINKLLDKIHFNYFGKVIRIIYIFFYIRFASIESIKIKYKRDPTIINTIITELDALINDIIKTYFNTDIQLIQYYDILVKDSEKYQPNNEELTQLFDRKPNGYVVTKTNPDAPELLPLSIDEDQAHDFKSWRFANTKELNSKIARRATITPIDINYIRNNYLDDDLIDNNDYYKYQNIHNLISFIKTNLENLNTKSQNDKGMGIFAEIPLCFINANHSTLINLLTNIPILELEIKNIDYNEIFADCDELSKFLVDHEIYDFNFLFSQISKPTFVGDQSANFTEYFKEDFLGNKNELTRELSNLYDRIRVVIKNNLELITHTNKYYSNIFLENYLLFMDDYNIEIDEKIFFYNKFGSHEYLFDPTNNNSLPKNYISFHNKYYKNHNFMNEEEHNKTIKSIKNDLLIYNFDYDYNIICTKLDLNDEANYINYSVTTIDQADKIFEKSDWKYQINAADKYNVGFANEANKYDDGTGNMLSIQYSNVSLANKLISSYSIYPKFMDNSTNILQYFLSKKPNYSIKEQSIPIIGLEHIDDIIKLIVYKIIKELERTNQLVDILNDTIKQITENEYDIPNKFKKILLDTFTIIRDDPELRFKIVLDKLIIYVKTIILEGINKESIKLVELIKDNILTTQIVEFINPDDLLDINSFKKLAKTSTSQYLIELLKKSDRTIDELSSAIMGLDTSNLVGTENRKLITNKCVNKNSLEMLRDLKFNFRILDRNGNTVINRLIDQYNIYAIEKVLGIDPNIITYKNNRGQDSITYLHSVIKLTNDYYMEEQIKLRYGEYEKNLENMIESNSGINEFMLDENKKVIQSIIRYSVYVFNEFLWLKILSCPNGWESTNKDKLKQLIYDKADIKIIENLLIKSLDDSDKKKLIKTFKSNVLMSKLTELKNNLEKDIKLLTNSLDQFQIEKKNKDVNKLINDTQLDAKITEITAEIATKQTQFDQLDNILQTKVENSGIIDKIYADISASNLIANFDFDYLEYNRLIKNSLSNHFINIILVANEKNLLYKEKFISNFNNSLMEVDLQNINNNELGLINDYNKKIIDDIYGVFYDLDKYEDSDYNYINGAILNIIYLNVVNILGAEMLAGILGYLAGKYADSKPDLDAISQSRLDNLEKNKIFKIIRKILKSSLIKKLGLENPNKEYIQIDVLVDLLKNSTMRLVDVSASEADNEYLNKIINFYIYISDNISINIYQEIVTLMDNLRKRSILIEILKMLKEKM
jgi:hypothetical protein